MDFAENNPYSQPLSTRFTSDLLSVAKPQPSTGKDGDWDKVFRMIQSNARDHEYFTSAKSEDGRTILHYACSRQKRKDAEESVRSIFRWCEYFHIEPQRFIDFVNLKDNKNDTALQLATKKRNKALVTLLIENGANIYLLKTGSHIDAINMIYDKVLINIFDRSIQIEKDAEDLTNESVWEIECDFGPVTGLHNLSSTDFGDQKSLLNQTRHLARVLRGETATRSAILQHPLVQIFLHIKGEKFSKILYASMIYHILWSLISFVFIFCNTHILDSTNIEGTSRDSNLTVLCQNFRIYESGSYQFHFSAYFYIMIFLYLLSVVKEIVELYSCKDKWYYWKQLENLGQWGVNITIFIVWLVALITRLSNTEDEEDYESFLEKNKFIWMNALPAIYMAGMFASLLLVQGQLTKTEILGLYNEMFAKGFINILKFLLAFLPLLLAFLITFHLLLPMKRQFLPSWGLGFAKLLSMMTGEMDYDDTFYGEDEEDIAFKNILKILYIVFVVTVVILLQNLLIGMTVSDVQRLEQKAKVNNLASRLEDIYLLENAVTHPWIVKVYLRYNLGEWFRTHFIVEKADSQVIKDKPDGTIKIRNKRLDEYPAEIRDVIIQWDKSHCHLDSTNDSNPKEE